MKYEGLFMLRLKYEGDPYWRNLLVVGTRERCGCMRKDNAEKSVRKRSMTYDNKISSLWFVLQNVRHATRSLMTRRDAASKLQRGG